MNILAIGDIVGSQGLRFLGEKLLPLKRECGADFVVVNGENAAVSGVGINEKAAQSIFDAGADVITTGNHAFRSRDYREVFERYELLLRPLNFERSVPGRGTCVFELGRRRIAVINLSGVSFMEPQDSPYDALDAALAGTDADIFVVDFHAEATAEKLALASYADGRVSVFFGTHTHVQTADERVLPCGTGYITDLGMTGPYESVLGVEAQCAVNRQRFRTPTVFSVAEGPCEMSGAMFKIDDSSGKCVQVQRINVR